MMFTYPTLNLFLCGTRWSDLISRAFKSRQVTQPNVLQLEKEKAKVYRQLLSMLPPLQLGQAVLRWSASSHIYIRSTEMRYTASIKVFKVIKKCCLPF